jgi:hypothetical protein
MTGLNLQSVELVPKLRRFTGNDAKKVAQLAKGIPSDPSQAERWIAQVIAGFNDDRSARFARDRQRLVVFKAVSVGAPHEVGTLLSKDRGTSEANDRTERSGRPGGPSLRPAHANGTIGKRGRT